MTILQIAIIVNIFTLSHQYFSEKKENENQIFEIDIDSLKHSKELPQINLLQIQIGSKAHHKNLSALLIFDSRSFYVASTNQIDRVDLIETEISSTNSANQFVYLKNGKYFAQNFIVSDQTAQIGPYLAIEDCNEIASAKSRSNLFTNSTGNFSNNQIIHLFHYNNIIFACGTSLCGLCIGVSPLLDRSRIYGPLIHQQNISLNIADATFYLLSKHKLIQLPMTSCSVYSTCSECFKSKSIRSSSDWCHWHENHCYLKSELPIQIAKEQPKCSPIVLDFEPKSGPVEGGTQIKFYGKNFGDSHQMIENHNSFLNITVGIFRCSVLEKKNDFVRCQIESDKQSVLDYMHSNPDGATISFYARDLLNISKRKFQIDGVIELPDKFQFVITKILGIHPTIGPFFGGTKMMIIGDHLNVGSKQEVKMRDNICEIVRLNFST
ncbi:hypothetical protein QR98_0085280 [Sarcoptes scabiei]|uniref:IPT/TIG domain-containing protein n=1 Tax=Sarcoptes scabiei TaxID=52283 RepID=A0A132AG70_SARSC|nr:hypothetical protein QR98_0085280 [Sarcoptes scabiei]